MEQVILAALPVFALFMILEAVSLWLHNRDHPPEEQYTGYEGRDTATSLSMLLGFIVLGFPIRALFLGALVVAYEVSPLSIDMSTWWPWVLLILAQDFCYYLDHRFHHRVRVGWAFHVVHHSSQYLNISTALRQPWARVTMIPFYVPLALVGFPPAAILLALSVELVAAFWTHTERIGRLPRPIEFLFVTPSHHRVHHGSDPQYLDRNYGGALIIWDRMFGTFAQETVRPTYGLTKNISTHNPLRVFGGEWMNLVNDLRAAGGWRERLGYVFGPPGWRPDPAEPSAASHAATAAGAPGRRAATPSGSSQPLVLAASTPASAAGELLADELRTPR